mmetsp:Transcript_43260/g.48715  ORF Transcript_43260/g.48715 Transcript_43260/m.48715 type:complete len:198 (-) Transcript_43260:164-757(-)
MSNATTPHQQSDEHTPFSVAFANNNLDSAPPVMMAKKKGYNKSLSRAAAVAITGILGITTSAFTFRQRYLSNSALLMDKDVSVELAESVDLWVDPNQCVVATGTFNHKISKQNGALGCYDNPMPLNPFQTCYQYANDAKYCWTASVYNFGCNSACVPVDSKTGGWHFVPWYYVNPHQTCGEPCTEFEIVSYVGNLNW